MGRQLVIGRMYLEEFGGGGEGRKEGRMEGRWEGTLNEVATSNLVFYRVMKGRKKVNEGE